MTTDSDLESSCRRLILDRVGAAGPAGLTAGGLRLPSTGTRKGKACRRVLGALLTSGEVGNLGSVPRPRYVAAEHFNPLERAYDHMADAARQAGPRLRSRPMLVRGLTGAVARKADEALRLLVDEGVLVRLKWAGNPLYLHAAALPGAEPPRPAAPDEAAVRRAYRETVSAFGYPDVSIHEVHKRLGGDLEGFKAVLLEASRAGRAVPAVGDWSLSSPEERAAALYINGHPHLRIRFRD